MLSSDTAAGVGRALEQINVPGGFGVNEVAFFHRQSRTLILTDLVENFEPQKLSRVMRPLIRLAGAMAPDGKAPLHYRFAINRKREQAAAAARRIIAWAPERVILRMADGLKAKARCACGGRCAGCSTKRAHAGPRISTRIGMPPLGASDTRDTGTGR